MILGLDSVTTALQKLRSCGARERTVLSQSTVRSRSCGEERKRLAVNNPWELNSVSILSKSSSLLVLLDFEGVFCCICGGSQRSACFIDI
ncbi:hypothetical protein AAHA92_04550 [Salvia divinorum]|uniref:Uncharacterized protein n=1 Tax=Salvia divinorum TaxID=28513 RepID=A0ABD1HZK0_SALDI